LGHQDVGTEGPAQRAPISLPLWFVSISRPQVALACRRSFLVPRQPWISYPTARKDYAQHRTTVFCANCTCFVDFFGVGATAQGSCCSSNHPEPKLQVASLKAILSLAARNLYAMLSAKCGNRSMASLSRMGRMPAAGRARSVSRKTCVTAFRETQRDKGALRVVTSCEVSLGPLPRAYEVVLSSCSRRSLRSRAVLTSRSCLSSSAIALTARVVFSNCVSFGGFRAVKGVVFFSFDIFDIDDSP